MTLQDGAAPPETVLSEVRFKNPRMEAAPSTPTRPHAEIGIHLRAQIPILTPATFEHAWFTSP